MPDTVSAFNEISQVIDIVFDNIKSISEASEMLQQNAKAASDVIGDIASIAEETAAKC